MKRMPLPGLRTIWCLLVALTLVPALAYSLRVRRVARLEAEESARESMLRMVRLAADRHERLMESTQQVLFLMGRLPAFQSGDLPACERLCADLIAQYPRYANLGIAQLDGGIAASGRPVQKSVNVANRPWFQRLVRDPDLHPGDYTLDEVSGRPVVVLSHPVLDGSGRLRFVAFAALDLDWLLRIFDEAHLPTGSVMTISDENGRILARTLGPEKWNGSPGPEAAALTPVSAGRDATAEGKGTDGVRRIYAVTRLQDTGGRPGAFVSAGIPTEEVYEGTDRSLFGNLLVLSLTAALALAAMWVAGETYIGRGLRSLGEMARRIQGGDLEARAGDRTEAAELAEAGRAMDDMAAALRTRAENGSRELASERESRAQADEALSMEILHLKEALRAAAAESVQHGRTEEALRRRESEFKQCLDSSVAEIARLKVVLSETSERLKLAEQQRSPEE